MHDNINATPEPNSEKNLIRLIFVFLRKNKIKILKSKTEKIKVKIIKCK
jgi:hypothetical protein